MPEEISSIFDLIREVEEAFCGFVFKFVGSLVFSLVLEKPKDLIILTPLTPITPIDEKYVRRADPYVSDLLTFKRVEAGFPNMSENWAIGNADIFGAFNEIIFRQVLVKVSSHLFSNLIAG